MGAVFLAEQIAVGNRPVALKVLSRKLLDDPDFLLRFQNEAASTGRIHHPNVVTIYESGQADDGTPYIAMEFLEGESLRQALARRGALPVVEVAEILLQAGRGLNAAHKRSTLIGLPSGGSSIVGNGRTPGRQANERGSLVRGVQTPPRLQENFRNLDHGKRAPPREGLTERFAFQKFHGDVGRAVIGLAG